MSEEQAPPTGGIPESNTVPTYQIPKAFFDKHGKPHLANLDEYKQLYKKSIEDPENFWADRARELLSWENDFHKTKSGTLAGGDNAWFHGGRLNASYNCVDRHAFKDPNKPAIIYEADEQSGGRTITYGELMAEVSKLAWVLKQMGVKKGDTVALYMPMIPEAVISFLACSRIGAVHSVVFAGFSSDSLRDRIIDAKSKVVITTDEGKRGGKTIGTKKIVDDALKQCPDIKHCLVYKRTGTEVPFTQGRDLWGTRRARSGPHTTLPSPWTLRTLSSCSTPLAPLASPRVSCTQPPATCWAPP
jgi:acetyl-CoA synthetase